MLRMIESKSAAHAKEYFVEGLAKADYYMADQGQERQGHFQGKLADRLGITGPASKEVFFALCENKTPNTGKSLTPHTKDERLTGWDFNFHCPKSLSVLHALSQDNHIAEAFQESVTETMRDIENDSKTRVRKGGISADRSTGELAWCTFVHETARPVKGHVPDMHLHAHAYVFNATYDEKEGKIKAAKWRDIKRDAPYYQVMFQKRLADKMTALGYRVRRTHSAFEIEGVPQNVIDHFSKRTDEIGRAAKKLGITDAKALSELGARTRSKKDKGLTMAELKADWKRQIRELSSAGDGDKSIRFAPVRMVEKGLAEQCINHAVEHCFERASVTDERRVLREAFRHAIGRRSVTVEEIKDHFAKDKRIIRQKQGSRSMVTTASVLQQERDMVETAQAGRGVMKPLYTTAPAMDLQDQQEKAASHILTTNNRVSIVMGAAGVGKTKMMQETVAKIEAMGKKVFIAAPTAEATHGVLKGEGFDKAETVAKLLIDTKMQGQLQDGVLWVDEAGLLGVKDMGDLLKLVTEKNARLILSGDTRQHSSVVRGDALRVLNTVGGIKAAEINKIRRQKDADYRATVQDLADGQAKQAFEKLDKMGAIKTIDPLSANSELVEAYVSVLKSKKTALVVSPTHKQGNEVTAAIREKLREQGMIARSEVKARKLENTNMTEAEKMDWRNYKQGQLIQFNQHLSGIKRGSQWRVGNIEDGKVEIIDEKGKLLTLPRTKALQYDVFEEKEISLSKGDRVRITRNGFDTKKKRMNNGMHLEVVSLNEKGEMVLRNNASRTNYRVERDFGHLSHAHVITSHSSQGKTVDEVFISQPSATFGATDLKQFYVSVSRGRNAVHIYTDDKVALLDHASTMGDRQSALELVTYGERHKAHVEMNLRSQPAKPDKTRTQDKTLSAPNKVIDRDYEPE